MAYSILEKIAIADCIRNNGLEEAEKKFNAKRTALGYIKSQVEKIDKFELMSEVAQAIDKTKLINPNQDPNNNRDKGIEYYSILDLVYQINLFNSGGNALTMPGPSNLQFEKRLLECSPNLSGIVAVEKDRLKAERLFKLISDPIKLQHEDVFEYLRETRKKFKLIWLDLYGMSTDKDLVRIIKDRLEVGGIFAITENKRGYDPNKEDERKKFRFNPDSFFKHIPIIYKPSWNYFPGMEFRLFILEGR